jgi:hypothetical protein
LGNEIGVACAFVCVETTKTEKLHSKTKKHKAEKLEEKNTAM